MKKTFIIIYSIFASLILIFSITFFSINIYNEKAHGELRTQVRFGKLANSVTNTLKKDNLANSESMRQIENSIGDIKDFAYIKISLDKKIVYIYPEDLQSSQEDNSKLVIPYKYSFETSDKKEIEVIAGLYSLRPATIHYYAKISFFIILIVALITIILIIYNNYFDKGLKEKTPAVRKNVLKFDEEAEEDADDSEDTEDTEDTEDKEDTDLDNSEKDFDKDDDKKIIKEETEKTAEEKKVTADNDEKVEASPAPAAQNAQLPVKDLEPLELEKAKTDQGLFSPDTGLGWESYLMTRLDNELNRATASELDLALFVIKLDGLERKNPLMKKICDYLTLEFQFKDLLFEYQEDSICAIKISMNIDSAVTFGEKLVEEIQKLGGEQLSQVLVGITSRGIRMVSGQRLLKEADEAVNHTDAQNPVVGFRADAIKYRKFIESN